MAASSLSPQLRDLPSRARARLAAELLASVVEDRGPGQVALPVAAEQALTALRLGLQCGEEATAILEVALSPALLEQDGGALHDAISKLDADQRQGLRAAFQIVLACPAPPDDAGWLTPETARELVDLGIDRIRRLGASATGLQGLLVFSGGGEGSGLADLILERLVAWREGQRT